jgi:integrase
VERTAPGRDFHSLWTNAFSRRTEFSGLATELAEASVPLTVLQNQLRHADVKTTLKVYAHVIPQSQRDAMENIGEIQSLRSTNTLLKFGSK